MATFHVAGLPTCTHTDETKRILDEQNDKSGFVRTQVLKFANQYGFEWQANGHKPGFMSNEKWQEYVKLAESSRRIDYTFFIAYHWLKSLEQFRYSSDANLLRLIVLSEL